MAGRNDVLAALGRRSYVSQSALAEVLKEIREIGYVPETSSRSSIKRARQEALDIQTPHGKLLQRLKITFQHPETKVRSEGHIDYIHPVAMLFHAAATCQDFAAQLLSRLAETPNTVWQIILYCDEVLPGNQLKHDNKKKLQAVYWSLKQLGTDLNCYEQAHAQ